MKMAKSRAVRLLEDCPIIAAVKDEEGLKHCLEADNQVVFILFGDILNIASIVEQVKLAGRYAFVHVDLIAGLSGKEIAVDYIKKHTRADGIISTRPMLIKRARELSMLTVLRIFMIDSMSFRNIEKDRSMVEPDIIEIMPGVMPKVIRKAADSIPVPVIAGGLIMDKEDIMAALDAGAVSVSTTREETWRM